MSFIDSDPVSIVCLASYVEGIVGLKEMMQLHQEKCLGIIYIVFWQYLHILLTKR